MSAAARDFNLALPVIVERAKDGVKGRVGHCCLLLLNHLMASTVGAWTGTNNWRDRDYGICDSRIIAFSAHPAALQQRDIPRGLGADIVGEKLDERLDLQGLTLRGGIDGREAQR